MDKIFSPKTVKTVVLVSINVIINYLIANLFRPKKKSA